MDDPTPYRQGRTTALAIGASLLLHGALVLPALLWRPAPPEAERSEKLLVELLGMVADRQTEASAPPAAPPAEPEPLPAEEPPPKPESHPPKPVKPTPRVEKPRPAPSPVKVAERPPVPQAPTPPPPPAPSEREAQVQQRLDAQAQERARIKQYLAQLRKRIQTHLDYPDAAKKDGYQGTPVVRFVILPDGEIRPGSLAIARSSGHSLLDANALDAARSSAPFARPDKEMEVAIGISFAMQR
ncbi:energy transducer TonB [Pseudomonas solani]|uniref:energy transducer TonB n=1 Tax=Pseudomonas solani TaxID=2731552 RepID=UPI003C2E6DB7